MNQREPDSPDRGPIKPPGLLPPELLALIQRSAEQQRRSHEAPPTEFERGYRAFFEGQTQRGSPGHSEWARGWQYGQLEDDDD